MLRRGRGRKEKRGVLKEGQMKGEERRCKGPKGRAEKRLEEKKRRGKNSQEEGSV